MTSNARARERPFYPYRLMRSKISHCRRVNRSARTDLGSVRRRGVGVSVENGAGARHCLLTESCIMYYHCMIYDFITWGRHIG